MGHCVLGEACRMWFEADIQHKFRAIKLSVNTDA